MRGREQSGREAAWMLTAEPHDRASVLQFGPALLTQVVFTRHQPHPHRQQFSGRGRSSFPFSSICSFPRKNVQKVGAYHTKNYDGGNCSRLRRVAMAIYGRQKNQFMDFTFHFMDRVSFSTGFWRFGESMNDLNGKLLLPRPENCCR